MFVTRLEGGPKKVNHAAVAIEDKIFCFGGYCSGEDYEESRAMEVYVLDVDSLRWKMLPAPLDFTSDICRSDVPYHRYGHSAAAWKHYAYIWGGRNDLAGACNTLYCFDTEKTTWARPKMHGRCPDKRDGHSAAILEDTMYIFGGFEETRDRFSSAIFAYHILYSTWNTIRLAPGSPQPMPRDFTTMVPLEDKLYVWGGRGDLDEDGQHTGIEKYDNFLWRFDPRACTWTQVETLNGVAPPSRRSHTSFVRRGKFYIFGGYDGTDHFNDMWMFDPRASEAKWSQITFSAKKFVPKPRRRMACCVANDRLFLFGGTSPVTLEYPYSTSFLPEAPLFDHDDLFLMEFMPKLKTLALMKVIQHDLPIHMIPKTILWDMLCMKTPNSITEVPQRTRGGNHNG
ncbi:hypothetical protein RvY_11518-2 [Ramazzottius varieornatus]|uniref:Kelch domain-containing protein 3 n=1 Tax=Ramazzottius varieornatus TaxID=947166 RepID=A0A1D1VLS5_RAMVA|nr:hypothetical protein RvY_11518-2 [Ramazzottius varieornatus]